MSQWSMTMIKQWSNENNKINDHDSNHPIIYNGVITGSDQPSSIIMWF